ncbi:MAG: NHLP bacteriocin system secretion protein [Bdellovibrionales bacterium]|nr:NHLP bacteriocin system secretion protein [Bdellovibrionales bacterium]
MSGPQAKLKSLFSEESLQKLSSPEQLDQAMKVTKPTGWLALAGAGIALLAVIVWGIVGAVPSKVNGKGIFVKSGGIYRVVTVGDGQIRRIIPKVGDQVEQGNVVATVALPALEQQVASAKQRLREIEDEFEAVSGFSSKDLALQLNLLQGRRDTLTSQRTASEQKVDFLRKRVESLGSLLQRGLITKQQLFETEQALVSAQDELKQNTDALNQLQVEENSVRNRVEGGDLQGQLKIEEARREVAQLESELRLKSDVRTPYSGRVVEITGESGNLVSPGDAILAIEARGKKLEAVVYVSPTDGKKVRPGMPIHIAPSTVKKEQFGLLVGKIRGVSEYPSTPKGMMSLLENEQLVNLFSEEGPPIAVYADLEIDNYTDSGYRWTSGNGPSVSLSGGTVLTAEVTVQSQRPIELVIPFLKSRFGLS